MQLEEFKKEYKSMITSAQLEKMEELEEEHGGFRSIWYDIFLNSVNICGEETGDIVKIMRDGETVLALS